MIRDPDAYAELREIELDLLDAAARGSVGIRRAEPAVERLAAAPHNRNAMLLAQALAERRAREEGGLPWRWSVAWPAAAALVAAVGLGLFALRSTPAERLSAGRDAGTIASARTAQRNSAEAPGVPPANTPTAPPGGTVSRDGQPVPGVQPPLSSGNASSVDAPGAPSATAPGVASNASPSATPGLAPSASQGVPPSASPSGPATTTPRPAGASPDAARMVALFLPAGTLRGARPAVRVPREAETVQLEIEIESPAPAFVTVTLRAVSDTAAASDPSSSSKAAIWTAARVPVRADRDQRIAIVTIPAHMLPAGAIEAHITSSAPTALAAPSPASAPIRIIPFLVRRD